MAGAYKHHEIVSDGDRQKLSRAYSLKVIKKIKS